MRVSFPGVPAVLAALLLQGLATSAGAQAAGIYSCEVNGKRITSDRPIPECLTRDQRVLNSDGSTRRILPPTPTADERAAQEERDAQAALERANRREAVRRDRNLLQRFPTQAAHDKARAAALEDVRLALRASEQRLDRLQKDRKPLLDETEFYVGKALPVKLKQQLEGNDAASEAQRNLIANQQAELVRITTLYDAELERLRKLWAGALPGSLGPLPTAAPAPASAPSAPASGASGAARSPA